MGTAKNLGFGLVPFQLVKAAAARLKPGPTGKAALALLSLLLPAALTGAPAAPAPADSATPQPYALVVAGLGGEPDYEKQFKELGERVVSALRKSGLPPERIVWLPPDRSRREELARAFEAAAARVRPDEPLLVFLIGHGSFDGEYKMNLPGPDATAADFRQWLDRVPARKQVVLNSTSASGGAVAAWSRAGRAILAATKSGEERNATVFMRFFADALSDPGADQDKNGVVSALEAFRYAAQGVAKFYESAGRLATEHPQLEDTGDGAGVRDPSPQNGKGLLAATGPLVRWSAQTTRADTPAARELRARKQSLENDLETLRYRRASLSEQEYSTQLEKLLLELARTQQRLEQMEKP